LLLLVLQPFALAQQATLNPSPHPEKSAKLNPLDQILVQLEKNFLQYNASIPSFFCNEHVVSELHQYGVLRFITRTDSIFRVKRTGHDKSSKLIESREIKSINDKHVENAPSLSGPAILVGAFSAATAIVTYDQKACFTYRLITPLFGHRYTIEYATKSPKDQDKHCTMTEASSGRAFIDSRTMQIVRIECRTPNHPMPGSTGLWTWSIDYGKVILDGKVFWLPKKINTEAASYSSPLVWSFDATYRDYHELNVTSRIIP
jgi:hypothetical protein